MLFGLVPAIQASKIDFVAAIKSGSGFVVGGRGRAWIRSSLVLVQVSLSFVLLVGAGLPLKSLQGMQSIEPGFSTKNVLVPAIDMVAAGYDTQRMKNFQDQLLETCPVARRRGVRGVRESSAVQLSQLFLGSDHCRLV